MLWSFLIVAAIAGYIVYLAAASGLVEVPTVSQWAFKTPVPDHAVEPSTIPFDAWFSRAVSNRVSSNLTDRTIELTLPESVLTRLIRQGDTSSSRLVDFSKSQVAVAGESIEIFLPLKDTALTWRVRPSVEEGWVKLSTESLRVGGAPVPRVLARLFLDRAVKMALAKVKGEVQSYADLTDVRVTPEGLLLKGALMLDVQKL
ncbi:hypothetical protein HYW18_01530 [Candidatus Uhrbacteria bacterium]|nr:hypothetical protein [Candidatus Uhrbacteria bacterium]